MAVGTEGRRVSKAAGDLATRELCAPIAEVRTYLVAFGDIAFCITSRVALCSQCVSFVSLLQLRWEACLSIATAAVH